MGLRRLEKLAVSAWELNVRGSAAGKPTLPGFQGDSRQFPIVNWI
jgi:hypothetical protein